MSEADEAAPRLRTAAALRDLADRLTTAEPSPADWEHLAAALAEATRRLAAGPASLTHFTRGVRRGSHVAHPLEAGGSAIYPPMDVQVIGNRLVAEGRFGPAWEGPPGLVHGGFLAAGFDMALSTLAGSLMGPSVTRWLRLRYLRPTPLGAALRYEVKAGERRGRLLDLSGELSADGRVTIRAKGQFASVAGDRFSDLAGGRPARRSLTDRPEDQAGVVAPESE